MSAELPFKRLDVAIGIVVRDAQILICRRKPNDSFGGFWEFPGGKCHPGESPAEAVKRELLEELEIVVTPTEALASIGQSYPKTLITLHPFICRLVSGIPKAISASEFRWVEAGELKAFRFPPANVGLLEMLANRFTDAKGIDLPSAGA